ncbi:hypothetical protein N7488_007442 [Penicillium malachiteum]|nr:hypothetical protein N7488_007442 [Penicillium malachiteum]
MASQYDDSEDEWELGRLEKLMDYMVARGMHNDNNAPVSLQELDHKIKARDAALLDDERPVYDTRDTDSVLHFMNWCIKLERGAPTILAVADKLIYNAIGFPIKRTEELNRVLPWLWKYIGDSLDHSTVPAVETSRARKRLAISLFLTDKDYDFNKLCEGMDFDQAEIPCFFPTPEDLEPERISKAEEIFESYHRLRKIMMHYENDIANRFLKRNEQKRRHVIQTAWDDTVRSDEAKERARLAKEHFEDYKAISYRRIMEKGQKVKGDSLYYSFLLPSCVNLHDLISKHPAVLAMLLHSRSHNAPDTFAIVDEAQIYVGDWVGGYGIFMPYTTDHGMQFFGMTTPEDYGKLVPYDEVVVNRQGWGCGRGMLLLDAQRRLYAFLLHICLKVAQINLATLDALPENPAQPVQVDPEHIATGVDDLLTFRYPGRMQDIDESIELLQIRRDEAVSHLKALRNQPDYFGTRMNEVYNHAPEHANLLDGSAPPERNHKELLKRSAMMVVSNAFSSLLTWDKLLASFTELSGLLHQYENEIANNSVEQGIPAKLCEAISYCDALLDSECNSLNGAVIHAATGAPKSREQSWIKKWTRNTSQLALLPTRYPDWRDEGGSKYMVSFKLGDFGDGTPAARITKALNWSLLYHSRDPFQSQPLLELDRDMLTTEGQLLKEYATRYTMETISDLVLVCVCQMQFMRFHPWISVYRWGWELDDEGLLKEKPNHLRYYGHHKGLIRNEMLLILPKMRSLDRLVACTDGKTFDYPIHQFAYRNTKKLTETLQTAERALEDFWNELSSDDSKLGAFKNDIEAIAGQGIPGLWPELDENKIRTPDWVEPSPQAQGPSNKRTLDEMEDSKSTAIDLPIRTQEKLEPKPKRQKIKTRGVPTYPQEEQAPAPQQAPVQEEIVTFTVKEREYNNLDLLFFVPDQRPSGRELHWGDFLNLMEAMGFERSQRGGSAVRFEPPEVFATKGSIVFHAPHPEHYWDLSFARNAGTRLKDHYGLSRENFVRDNLSSAV